MTPPTQPNLLRFVPLALIVILLAGGTALFFAGADVKEASVARAPQPLGPARRPATPATATEQIAVEARARNAAEARARGIAHRAAEEEVKRAAELAAAARAQTVQPGNPSSVPGTNTVAAALTRAAVAGNTNELAKLLTAHPHLLGSTNNSFGSTPLHFAAYNRQADAVRFLLAQGADPNSQNRTGTTPLLDAIGGGSAECVELLLRAGANPRVRNRQGFTPLALAKRQRRETIIPLLITAGATE
ncbi:MAG: ankyrin repeat domain-containing protein [Limisphaerales bacterium]